MTNENEKRIYVVVATTVQNNDRSIVQPVGRIAAQVGHVVSKLRMAMAKSESYPPIYYPVTTIVLAARDNKEMKHVAGLLLLEGADVPFVTFEDENGEAYGPGSVTTALATFPVLQDDVWGKLDYLPLYNGGLA